MLDCKNNPNLKEIILNDGQEIETIFKDEHTKIVYKKVLAKIEVLRDYNNWDEFIERSNDFLSKVPNATYKSKGMYKEVCIILENMVALKMDEKVIRLQKELCLHLAKIQIDKIAPLRDNT